jgi:hypothetical protein
MKYWESQIPKKNKNRDTKRCYWLYPRSPYVVGASKVVWLSDKEKTLYFLKYPNCMFEQILEKDTLEAFKKFMHEPID